MDWLTTLRRSGGINALSRQIGVSPAEVAAGAEALLTPLIGGLRRRADQLGGGDAGVLTLINELIELGGGELAAEVMSPAPLDNVAGNAILANALGPEVARRAVVLEAERVSGVGQDVVERMLPGLAMLVGGYITARAGGSGAAGSAGLDNPGSLLDTLTTDGDHTDADRI
jgi:hypothetical protein